MRTLPCALAVGGLDPGGGAGLAADLRAFRAAGAFGCAAIAVVTVQSTDGLLLARPISSSLVIAQASEVVRAQNVRAIKVGALGSAANVAAVARWLSRQDTPVVVDPVMVPTRHRRSREGLAGPLLLSRAGVGAMRNKLLPQAILVTANAPEAAALTGLPVNTVADARVAACALVALGASAALVKGGHLAIGRDAVDILALGPRFGDAVLSLRSKRLALPTVHGGGCTLASLIAGRLAVSAAVTGRTLEEAVRWGREAHQISLRDVASVGGIMKVLTPE